MSEVALIYPEQYAFLLLSKVGEAFEVDDQRQLAFRILEFGDCLRYQVMMLHGRDRQFQSCHAPDLLRPEAGRVHDMFGGDHAVLGHHSPSAIGPRLQIQHAIMLDHRGAAQFRSLRIGMHHAGRIDIAFPIGI